MNADSLYILLQSQTRYLTYGDWHHHFGYKILTLKWCDNHHYENAVLNLIVYSVLDLQTILINNHALKYEANFTTD